MSVVVSAVVVAFEAWGTAAFVGAAMVAVADVGVATTLVGAVTGNKTMMKVGGALSIVGGVGGLINSAVGTGASVAADTLANTATSAAGDTAAGGIAAAGADAGVSSAGIGADLGTNGIAAANSGAGISADAAGQWGAVSDPIKFGANLNAGQAAGAASSAADQGLSIAGQGAAAPAGTAAASDIAGQALPITGQGAPGAAMASGDFSGVIQPAGGPNAAGMYGTPATHLADTATPGLTSGVFQAAPSSSIGDMLKSGFDATSAWFKGLPATAQGVIVQQLMAIPGGIQAQKNAAAQLAVAQQKVNQSSYGNSAPTFNSTANPTTGILSNAMRK